MEIQRLSIKSLTITILIVIAGFSVLLSFVSGEYFFKAARESQLYSLNRVIQVATKEIMQQLHDQAYDIATALSIEGEIPKEFVKAVKGETKGELVKALDDPLITGFVGAYIIDLVKVRAYDLKLNFIAESHQGIQGLSPQMPKILYQQGYGRKGVARSKAISGLWQHADKSYYSVLVPIGGIFISGYLEVVVNPVNNLVRLSEKMNSPISIRSGIDPKRFYYEPKKSTEKLLPIEYELKTDLGASAFLLTSYEDIAKLSEGVKETVFNTISVFIGLVLIVLLIAIWLFQLLLFKPVNLMLNEIRNITDGDISRDLQVKGLAEIAILSGEFNKMTKEIRSREEVLTRLSVIDALTKIANRRKFDEVLKNEYLLGCRSGKPLSILMIDIDYFKQFNDTYGHLAGDDCIKKVATALKRSVYRPTDLVARYGGEEFAIILPDTTKSGERVIAEKIMSEIARLNIPHSSSSVDDKITVSIGGYAVVPSIHDDPVFIVAEADKSLYQAKGAGRNQFVLRNEFNSVI
ncbi:MAG: diguanylate cyclase [Gammaproteobacteria bacterium]|nr:diguanylate cyclase [Gammaproteobacteria bacterium]